MTKPARTGLLAASLVLVAAAVTGCSGTPDSATEADFCREYDSLLTDLADMSGTTQKEALATIKKWGRDLQEVGTPTGMPQQARDGFELMTSQVADLDDAADAAALDQIEAGLSASEKEASAAFEEYAADTCGTPEVPTPPAG